jgi:hypothetical protein
MSTIEMDFARTLTNELRRPSASPNDEVTEEDSAPKRGRLYTREETLVLRFHKWVQQTGELVVSQILADLKSLEGMGISWYTKEVKELLTDLAMDVVKFIFSGSGCVADNLPLCHEADTTGKYARFGYREESLEVPAGLDTKEMCEKVFLHLLMQFVVNDASRMVYGIYNEYHPPHHCHELFEPSEWNLSTVAWKDLGCSLDGKPLDKNEEEVEDKDDDPDDDEYVTPIGKHTHLENRMEPAVVLKAKGEGVCRIYIDFQAFESNSKYTRTLFYLSFGGQTEAWMADVFNDFMRFMRRMYKQIVVACGDEAFVSSLVRDDGLGAVTLTRDVGAKYVCDY